ncbi:MAG: hypothetical protein JWM06_1681 [Actinomycetia bacterium]|nr:hypothetical protein [Actinomycetes bacterium]
MTEIRPVRFRGGPVDGRLLRVPVSHNRHWPLPTVDGVWIDDWKDRAPRDDLMEAPREDAHYWRVGDGDDSEYVHISLLDELPPELRRFA